MPVFGRLRRSFPQIVFNTSNIRIRLFRMLNSLQSRLYLPRDDLSPGGYIYIYRYIIPTCRQICTCNVHVCTRYIKHIQTMCLHTLVLPHLVVYISLSLSPFFCLSTHTSKDTHTHRHTHTHSLFLPSFHRERVRTRTRAKAPPFPFVWWNRALGS